MPRRTLEERFWAKVAKAGDDECWLWTAARSPKGYGVINRRSYGEGFAHRLALALSTGVAVPPEACVLHGCDTPACCNPRHLALGDRAENNRQMMSRGRHHAPRGEVHPRARLTERQVKNIRFLAACGVGHATQARHYGVSRVQISRIARGERWSVVGEKDISELTP